MSQQSLAASEHVAVGGIKVPGIPRIRYIAGMVGPVE